MKTHIFFFEVDHLLKSLSNVLQYCFCVLFGAEAWRILVPQPGVELELPALEGELLTTGLPEKSQESFLKLLLPGFLPQIVPACMLSHVQPFGDQTL